MDVLQNEDKDWVKKCMEYEVEGARPRGRPKKTWVSQQFLNGTSAHNRLFSAIQRKLGRDCGKTLSGT